MVVASGYLDTLSQLANIINPILVVVVGAVISLFIRAGERRDRNREDREKLRTSYRRLNISQETVLTQVAAPSPPGMTVTPHRTPAIPSQFVISRVNIENIGDGPVDIWGCFVAARDLNTMDHREAFGGNIEWTSLTPYYYDNTTPEGMRLDGISVTRHAVYSQDHFLQLDAEERETLTRIDRIDPLATQTTLLYRAFLVGRGYDDRRKNVPRDMFAWRRLQQALFTVSGPSFRILFGESDPLDRVADRDGWQCFMLFHHAFADDQRDGLGWTRSDRVNEMLTGEWGQIHNAFEAQALCERDLAAEVLRWRPHWEAFKLAVEECKRLPEGFADLLASSWRPTVTHLPKGSGDDLTVLTAREAFQRLPLYLRWDPLDEESLPIWEKYFVVMLGPDGPTLTR